MVNYTVSNVQANHTINAEFDKLVTVAFARDSPSHITGGTYTINGGSAQTINWSSSIQVASGSRLVITPTFASGYEIDTWEHIAEESGEIIESGTTVPATVDIDDNDCTISFTSKSSAVTYTITATADSGGTINPSGEVTVQAGANQTFAVTPNTGFQIKRVLLDGSPIQPDE